MGNWSFGNITRHSIILVAAGLSFIAMGVSIRQYMPNGPLWNALVVARNIMSLDLWGLVFIVCGILIVIFAHWPHLARTWGYMILTGVCLGWSMFYLTGTVIMDDKITNLSHAVIWGLQSFIWWSISGLPDVAADVKVRAPLWTGLRKND